MKSAFARCAEASPTTLDAAARRRARDTFDPSALTARLDEFLGDALEAPKRAREWLAWGEQPAGWFA